MNNATLICPKCGGDMQPIYSKAAYRCDECHYEITYLEKRIKESEEKNG